MTEEALPIQKKGAHFDTHEKAVAENREQAITGYINSRKRLFDVNNWGKYAQEAPDTFLLTDDKGNPVQRDATKGDLIKIHLPGPRSAIGDGGDWVAIDNITEDRNKMLDEIFTAMTLRPCPNPHLSQKTIAHFYELCATNTAIVCRHKTEVIVSFHGRNEVINTDTDWVDFFRNLMVALPAKVGLSNPHWKKVAKGLLVG